MAPAPILEIICLRRLRPRNTGGGATGVETIKSTPPPPPPPAQTFLMRVDSPPPPLSLSNSLLSECKVANFSNLKLAALFLNVARTNIQPGLTFSILLFGRLAKVLFMNRLAMCITIFYAIPVPYGIQNPIFGNLKAKCWFNKSH